MSFFNTQECSKSTKDPHMVIVFCVDPEVRVVNLIWRLFCSRRPFQWKFTIIHQHRTHPTLEPTDTLKEKTMIILLWGTVIVLCVLQVPVIHSWSGEVVIWKFCKLLLFDLISWSYWNLAPRKFSFWSILNSCWRRSKMYFLKDRREMCTSIRDNFLGN